MRLKSYFAGTVEAAMDLARRELGEEALLVHARPSSNDTRHLGAFEVVFGTTPPEQTEDIPQPQSLRAAAAAQSNPGIISNNSGTISPDPAMISHDLAQLRREMESMAHSMRLLRSAHAAATVHNPAIYQSLVDAELESELARQVADGTPLENLIQVDITLGRVSAESAGRARIVMLVGPPAAGKTTTLVKLAARYALPARRPSHIITTDVHRIAAADQLRTLAAILGIGCTIAETPAALEQILEEHRLKEFVFIDTPGLARGEMNEGAELARFAASREDFDIHLVLPAHMKPADVTATVDRFQMFSPRKWILTHLDQTSRFGAPIGEAARRGIPVSFLSSGQQIPDDLEPASKSRLSGLLTSGSSAPMLLARALRAPLKAPPVPERTPEALPDLVETLSPKVLLRNSIAKGTKSRGASA